MVIVDKPSENQGDSKTSPAAPEDAPPPSLISRPIPQISNVTLAERYEAYEEIENDAEQEAEKKAIRGDKPKKEVRISLPKKESKSCRKCLIATQEYFSIKSRLKHCWRTMRKNLILVSNHSFIHHGKMRSRDSVQKERARQITTSGILLHPYSLLRFVWEVFIIICSIFFLLYQPVSMWILQLGEDRTWTIYVVWIFSAIFILDVVTNYRTGIIDSNSNDIRLDQRRICSDYFQTWFPLDFISSVPWENIAVNFYYHYSDKPTIRYCLMIHQLGVLRYFLIFRLFRYLRNVLLGFGCNGLEIRLIHTCIRLILTTHWFACAHAGVEDLCYVIGEPILGNSWIIQGELSNLSRRYLYPFALPRSLGLHYSHILPRLYTEITMLCLNTIILFILLTMFVAYFFALLQTWDVTERRFINMSTEMGEYMKFYHTPVVLRKRVLDYLQTRYTGHHFRQSILRNLSPCIQKDLLLNNCLALVEEVPFFSNLQRHILQEIVLHLEFDVYMENDVLIWAGTFGDGMYFIEHGSVSILAPDGRPVTILKDGNFFGEMSLVFSEPRAATVVAHSKSDIYRLSKENFMKVIAPYPKLYETIVKVAEARAKFLDRRKLYKRKKDEEE